MSPPAAGVLPQAVWGKCAIVGKIHGKPMMSYLTYMTQRILEMHRVLKSTGSFYLHCDQTASHYLKAALDCIFGAEHFRNEVVWCYAPQGRYPKRGFHRKHDNKNLQLLCGHCNSVKGDRPMEYLHARLRMINRQASMFGA